MQLANLEVEGLFGRFTHSVAFPRTDEGEHTPSLTILHGRNGVGKTTVLRMLAGLMTLDFDVFRQIPFGECTLEFSSEPPIRVDRTTSKKARPLRVRFDGEEVVLHPRRKGAFEEGDAPKVEAFRDRFFDRTRDISFNFIDTHRVPEAQPTFADIAADYAITSLDSGVRVVGRHRGEEEGGVLAGRVSRFISNAQADYRNFFVSTEPDLFSRLMARLAGEDIPEYRPDDLITRLSFINDRQTELTQYGLGGESWDYGRVISYLEQLTSVGGHRSTEALAMLGGYTEVLESRLEERQLVAERLRTFEDVLEDFFLDKRVVVDPQNGFRILSAGDEVLRETQLSSGEYHLLYLMVAALITRKRGTVIAIDEPEMSMHIAWQRKLIRSLFLCASNATPQFVFATHSPDVVADYRESLVQFGAGESDAET